MLKQENSSISATTQRLIIDHLLYFHLTRIDHVSFAEKWCYFCNCFSSVLSSAVSTLKVDIEFMPCEPVKHQYYRCGMTTVSSQLVTVGGRDVSTLKASKTVRVYTPSLWGSWKQSYPPIRTHLVMTQLYPLTTNIWWWQVGVMVVTYLQLRYWTPLSTIVSGSLPRHSPSAAITHGTLYLLGGSLGKQVLSVSLSALTQTDKPPAQWRTLPNTPLEYSTAIAVHGSLLAVGGSHGGQRSSAIHVYDQEKNTWNKVGDLPTE